MKGIVEPWFRFTEENNKGKIEIEYYSRDELERIMNLLNQLDK